MALDFSRNLIFAKFSENKVYNYVNLFDLQQHITLLMIVMTNIMMMMMMMMLTLNRLLHVSTDVHVQVHPCGQDLVCMHRKKAYSTCIQDQSNHELQETWILSSHRTLFQANSDEICRRFNKTVTLPSFLLSRVFDSCIIFCKYPCFSPILG